MFCRKCGSEIIDGDKFCRKCGTPVRPIPGVPEPGTHLPEENRVTADEPEVRDVFLEEPEAQPPKKNKVWIPIVIAAVVLAVAAVVVFVVLPILKDRQTGAPQQAVVEEPAPVQEPEVPTMPVESLPVQTEPETPEEESTTVEIPDHQQKITIAKDGGGYQLTLENWIPETGEWTPVFHCPAKISPKGTTTKKTEGDGYTPAGTFNVLFAIGATTPSTDLDFISVRSGDVWVDDSSSAYYNTIQRDNMTGKDWKSAENIYSYFTGGYNAAIFFDYNGDGVTANSAKPGNGSVLFILGSKSFSSKQPASGDIHISDSDMTTLLLNLDSKKAPTVTIE